jgi:CheY-like chemotaxis protein
LGDATRLQQALLNYATNAIKFTADGSITIRAEVLEEDDAGVLLRFEVADTGIGIEPEVMPRLFSAFEQADSKTTRRYGGTGLGLAITRKIAQLMGGEAGCTSTPGSGSIFWFTARLKKSGAVPAALELSAQEKAIEMLKHDFAGTTILLAEDEPVNREVATMMLEDAGLVIDLAVNGEQAVEKAAAHDYALILMDMQMPVLDGLDATRRIRATAGGSQVPIIAMTANAFAEDKARCMEVGMNDFLSKPVDPELLYATLWRWLSKKQK